MSVTQTPFAPSLDEHTAPPEPGNASRIQYNVAIGYCARSSRCWSWRIMPPLLIIRLLPRRLPR